MPNVVVEQPVVIFIFHGIDWTPWFNFHYRIVVKKSRGGEGEGERGRGMTRIVSGSSQIFESHIVGNAFYFIVYSYWPPKPQARFINLQKASTRPSCPSTSFFFLQSITSQLDICEVLIIFSKHFNKLLTR